MLDLMPEAGAVDLDTVTRLQRLKTGALIGWCMEAGAILGRASPEQHTSVRGYSHYLGLGLGLPARRRPARPWGRRGAGRQARRQGRGEQGKEIFGSLLGAKRARRQADLLVAQAEDHLHGFGEGAQLLPAVARFAVARDH